MSDFTNLCDLAPTFLEAAGIDPPESMTGKSLLTVFESKQSGQVDTERTFVVTGMERHVYRYPSRAIRNEDYLYVRNFGAAKWPSGEVEDFRPEYDFAVTPWPTEPGAFSYNIDPSPTKQFLRLNRNRDDVKRFAALSFAPHPSDELYDLANDPSQLNNVADNHRYAAAKEQLRNLVAVVPPKKLALIRCVPVWLSPVYQGVRPKAEYHSSRGWLLKAGRRPELAACVELTNIDIFEKENRRMPMMILHELAHAFHHQVLGFDDSRVKSAYDRAVASGGYENVENHSGRVGRAYGMNNPKEYFAESTEAFFGINDFYPFNLQELKAHDPGMEILLRQIWLDQAMQAR